MKHVVFGFLWISLFFARAATAQAPDIGDEVSYTAADGVEITAYWREVEKGAPTIMLFHMGGGSAPGEYRNIAPRLHEYGFNTLAVDLRSGGERLGVPNKTAARIGADVPYCEAYPDLEASLSWLKANSDGPIIAWGSSFSAALTIQLAAKSGDTLSGALAFSPASGGPMAACRPDTFLDDLNIPLLTMRPDREMEVPSVIAQAKLFRGKGLPYLSMREGVHGALMLDPEQTGKDMNHIWGRVLNFLQHAALRAKLAAEEQTISLNVDGWSLTGSLVIPKNTSGPMPAVLMLSQAAGYRHDNTRLALALADRGIASLRLDMRAHGSSTNQGTFMPPYGETRHLLEGSERDAAAAIAYLQGLGTIDAERVGVVSGSYSTEFAALAARQSAYVRAYVALSPGSLSDESIDAINGSGADWYFIRAEIEQDFFDDIFGAIEAKSQTAKIRVLPGSGHAINLMGLYPETVDDIASWLEEALQ